MKNLEMKHYQKPYIGLLFPLALPVCIDTSAHIPSQMLHSNENVWH